MEKRLVAVITSSGELILETGTPKYIQGDYPCHAISKIVHLTTGSLEYWKNVQGSTPIYEGDKVEVQF